MYKLLENIGAEKIKGYRMTLNDLIILLESTRERVTHKFREVLEYACIDEEDIDNFINNGCDIFWNVDEEDNKTIHIDLVNNDLWHTITIKDVINGILGLYNYTLEMEEDLSNGYLIIYE